MSIDVNNMYQDLQGHIGHDVRCVRYGPADDPVNVAIECETCGEVLFSEDKPTLPERLAEYVDTDFEQHEEDTALNALSGTADFLDQHSDPEVRAVAELMRRAYQRL